MGKANKYSADLLRRKAETIIERKEVNLSNQLSEVEILRLIHELEVHQIELQLINDELNTAKENEELLAERFAELFDFAPSGYFILSRSGEIIELNRSGAEILGEKRLFLLGKHLSQFISHESGSAFVEFLDAVFQNAKNQKCKITLSGADKIPCYIQFIGSAFLAAGFTGALAAGLATAFAAALAAGAGAGACFVFTVSFFAATALEAGAAFLAPAVLLFTLFTGCFACSFFVAMF